MKPKTWLITDTHFNHEYLVQKGLRPKDAQDRIIQNWNRLIGDDDLVIHLGDVIFSRPSQLGHLMPFLSGSKILVRGNHDENNSAWYMSRGFDFACDGFLLDGFWFTHEPATKLPTGAHLNIHGHLHGNGHREGEYYLMPWNLKLALEDTNYMPVEMLPWIQENCPHRCFTKYVESGQSNCDDCKKQHINPSFTQTFL